MQRFTQKRWCSLCDRLGISGGARVFGELSDRYSESWRSYHNACHINDCLDQFDRSPALSDRPDEVEVALWLHDVIYDTRRTDNEERSALFATSILRAAECESEVVDRVAADIIATSHHAVASRVDEQLIVDIDLSVLGRPPREYGNFEAAIRSEYEWVPWATYREKRGEILCSFLNRERIYSTDWFADRFEANARLNLGRAIQQLASHGQQ